MPDESPIALGELIKTVKQELLETDVGDSDAGPLFSVDEVELELQVTIKKEGKAGIRIHVVELGGGLGRDDVQKVTVKLTPILPKEERVRLYSQMFPERWKQLERTSVEGALKGGQAGDDDVFGSRQGDAA